MKARSLSFIFLSLLLALSACVSAEKRPDDVAQQVQLPAEDTTEGMLAAAALLLGEGRAAEALTRYEQVLAQSPGNASARLGLAQANLLLKKPAEVRADLEVWLQEEPAEGRSAALLLGQAYEMLGSYPDAILLYQKYLEAEPHASDLLNRLIVAYRLSGEYGKGEEACNRLLSRDPDNAQALKNLSLMYYEQGKFALSETIANNSLKLNDKDASLYNNKGMIRVKKGRYPQAMAFFRRAVELDPKLLAPHLNIGSIALRYRDYETAARHYGTAVQLDPLHVEGNLGLAHALAGQQKPQEAISQVNRVLELDATQCDALAEATFIYMLQLSQLGEAKAWGDRYAACVGGKVPANDPMATMLQNIANELEAKQMQEEMQRQMEAEAAREAAANAASAPEGAAAEEASASDANAPGDG